ncbi:hypothetical protein [Anaerocolumna chitinilytica]|uniref:Uncharacterized protein n=1 Tax=Anaerocolumna chitinilytica TaxID=1727145 RepID=A0A7I8DLQ0_9FIRM|nr:hypothetical protein [Anaerocolumna chitinilytica]BCJ98211.1 hypothetical protein bsdcttw_12520 [Anaerocolumna chitinilytica]
MKIFILRHKKGIAVVLAVCVMITMVPMFVGYPSRLPILAANSNERKMAADISSSTGVDVDKILTLRKDGKSWNEILEELKGKGGSTEDRNQMDKLLTEEALGEKDVKMLLGAGFTKEEIQQATLIAERIQFQLQEITSSNGNETISAVKEMPETGEVTSENGDSTAVYKELEEKLNIKNAITLMLKLKAAFGSMEQVMDEYLYSLQVDINLEDYLTDRQAYQKKKNDKNLEAGNKKIITMSDIENEMLKTIQQSNVNNDTKEVTDSGSKPSDNLGWKADDKPKSPLPEVTDVTPRDPGEDILEEIQQINPLK